MPKILQFFADIYPPHTNRPCSEPPGGAQHCTRIRFASCQRMADSLVETCWRVRARSGYEFRCELYRVGNGVELRVSCGENKLVHAEPTSGIDAARQLALAWLRQTINLQDFQAPS